MITASSIQMPSAQSDNDCQLNYNHITSGAELTYNVKIFTHFLFCRKTFINKVIYVCAGKYLFFVLA